MPFDSLFTDMVTAGVQPALLRAEGSPIQTPEPCTSFDAAAARSFGQVAASLRRAGRKPAARAYDAMIAAVCLANELPIHTCNPDDFAHIDSLVVVDVPHPDH